jgi:hypothetical protein
MARDRFPKFLPIKSRIIELVYESAIQVKGETRLNDRQKIWRLSAALAFGILLVVSQMKLPPEIVENEIPALSLELDVGSPAEPSAEGTFYWVTKSNSTLILSNNTASPIKATLKALLSVAPCAKKAGLTVKANGLNLSGEIGPLQTSYRIDSPVSLDRYERRVVKLYVSGVGCPTAPSDGRIILSKLTAPTLVQ